MINEIAEGLEEHKKYITKLQYDLMCSYHSDYFLKKIEEEIPKTLTSAGKKYDAQVARAKIRKQVTAIESNICNDAKPIDKISPKVQKQIWTQLTSENCHYDVEDHDFVVSNLHPDALPITSIEYDIYDKAMSEEEVAVELRKVKQIAKKMENGYDDKYPIMLLYHDKPFSSMDLLGGHHRLQAVRNLMAEKKLPEDFNVPAVVICPKIRKLL